MKNFGIMSDENSYIILVEDNFRTKEQAQEYAENNNLIGEDYFIIELDEME